MIPWLGAWARTEGGYRLIVRVAYVCSFPSILFYLLRHHNDVIKSYVAIKKSNAIEMLLLYSPRLIYIGRHIISPKDIGGVT